MATAAEYAEMVEANGGVTPPFAHVFYRYSFFMYPGEMGQGGTCVRGSYGKHLPKTKDLEKAAAAALDWLRSVDPDHPYDRAKVSRSGEHPTWLRADGTRWRLPDDADLEAWGSCS